MTAKQHDNANNVQAKRTNFAYELRQLLTLGLPVMGAQIAQMGMSITDTIMAGRLSAQDLAGIALGTNVLWPGLLLCWGMLIAVTPTVSHLRGAGRIGEIGKVVHQALWLAAIGSLLVILVITNADVILNLMRTDPAITVISVPYLNAIAWGIPGVMGYFVLRYLVEGMGYTKPTLTIALCALCLNIPLNYIFMYGSFGFPALGGVGCGVSSAIIMWLQCLAMLVVAAGAPYRQTGCFSTFSWPKLDQLRKLIALGLPIGITSFLGITIFSAVALLLGRLGANVVASHQIAMNTAGVAYMLPLALGHAASIRIGFNVGAHLLDQARRTAQAALATASIVGASLGIIIFSLQNGIASLYSKDMEVITLAAKLLVFVAAFQIFDCIQGVAIGALRGYKATKFPLIVTFISYWLVALPLGYFLAYGLGGHGDKLGIYGFWGGLVVGIALVAAPVTGRLFWLANRPGRVMALAQH